MNLPFFYFPVCNPAANTLTLDEDTSRHIVQVLRMKEGGQLHLTDGKGNLLTCVIADAHKKHCSVIVKQAGFSHKATKKITIAISLLKNPNRFEWFLEKATEIGVSEIIPLMCERTEKEKFRFDRMNQICISAMLQSQQCWLPLLHQPVDFDNAVKTIRSELKLIAHCEDGTAKKDLSTLQPFNSSIILIGPEGDFTSNEIELAMQYGFQPVSLGTTRLRTETAGVVAAVLLCR